MRGTQPANWSRVPVNPYRKSLVSVTNPDVPVPVRQAIAALNDIADPMEILAPPGCDLANIVAVAGCKTIRLMADTIYRTTDFTINRPVEIVGPRSAIVQATPNATGTRKVMIDTSTPGKGGDYEPVILRGFTCELPIEAFTRCELYELNVACPSSLTTSNGAKVELLGNRSLVQSCYSDTAGTLGIYINNSCTDCRVLGTDFSVCTTAIEAWIIDSPHLGSDSNAGTILLH